MERHKIKFLAKASVATAAPVKQSAGQTEVAEQSYIDHQPDLMRIDAILVSTGMNYNGHTFLKDELIAAHGSARHKPMNVEHDEQKIVGHMTNSYIITKDGERLSEDMLQNWEKIPDDFDVVSESVMYAFIFPEQARKIRDEASNNRLFVSVEAWYDDYDYIVGNRIIERNETTMAYFEPMLKTNGGTGVVEGQRVGVVLRNLTYAGIGLVKQPANEESKIRSICGTQADNSDVSDDLINIYESFTKGFIGQQKEVLMAGKKLDKVQAKASEQKEENKKEEKEEKEEEVQEKEHNEETKEDEVVDKKDESTDDAQKGADELNESKDQDTLSELTKQLTDFNSQLTNMQEQIKERDDKLATYDKQLTDAMSKIEQLSKLSEQSNDTKNEQSGDDTTEDNQEVEPPTQVEQNKEKEESHSDEDTNAKPTREVEKEPNEQSVVDVQDGINDDSIEDAVSDALDSAEKKEDVVDFQSNDDDNDSLVDQFVEVLDNLQIGITKEETEQKE